MLLTNIAVIPSHRLPINGDEINLNQAHTVVFV